MKLNVLTPPNGYNTLALAIGKQAGRMVTRYPSAVFILEIASSICATEAA